MTNRKVSCLTDNFTSCVQGPVEGRGGEEKGTTTPKPASSDAAAHYGGTERSLA